MLELHSLDAYMETLETVILALCLLRIVQSQSLHPRMALISGTIARASSSNPPNRLNRVFCVVFRALPAA